MTIKINKFQVNLIFFEKSILFLIITFFSFPVIISNSSKIICSLFIILLLFQILHIIRTKQKIVIQQQSPVLIWMLFWMFFLLNRGPIFFSNKDITWAINLFCIYSFLIINSEQNIETIIFYTKTLVWVDSINAMATILFWIFPSLYSVYESAFLRNYLRIVGKGFKAGLTSHYSTNGMLLVLGLLASFSLIRTKKRRYIYFLGLFLISLILTTKRAHLVFGSLSCAFVFYLSNRKKGIGKWVKYSIILISIAVVWFAAIQFVPEFGATFERFENIEYTTRSAYGKICLDLFQERPIFGNGWNSFTNYLYGTYLGDEKAVWGNTSQNAHNVYLQVLAEQGIIGELIFLFAVGYTMFYSITLLNHFITDTLSNESDNKHVICLVFSLCLQTFFILYCLTGNPLYDKYIYIPLFFSFGVCCKPLILFMKPNISTEALHYTNN